MSTVTDRAASETTGPERWCVVGGGMLGLTVALRAAQAGHTVTVLEAAAEIGGLASAWTLESSPESVVWDRHYHVTLLSDRALRGLLGELGLEAEMRWVQTRTGYFADGRLSSVSNTVEFLRLPSLPTVSKLRLAATILYASRVRDWRRLEEITVADWLVRCSGRSTFERFWLPLLRAKLGESWREANAAFIWATIQRLYAARRRGLKQELFGYVPGGYARVLATFGAHLASLGVEVHAATTVTRIGPGGAGIVVHTRTGTPDRYDRVVVTSTPRVAERLCVGLTAAERARLRAVGYQGVVCASVLLARPLTPYYLTYLLADLPFSAVVEATAFVDRAELRGGSLVYLPKYVAPDDPLLEAPDDRIEASFLAGLREVVPHLRRADVRAFRVSRVREVFPIPTLGYSRSVPPTDTSVPGLHLVSSASIVNSTLNVDETIRVAEAAARRLLARPAPVLAGSR